MRHEENLRRHQLRPTLGERDSARAAYRQILGEAGWPEDHADPKPETSIVVRGPYGWLSGPC